MNKPEGKSTDSEPQPIIQVKNVYFSYLSGDQVLNGINLDIMPGDYLAVIGQNGSGKTTLVKHFNGLLKPVKGQVLVKGQDTSRTQVSDLSHYIGYCFQNPDHQIFNSTVYKEAAFGPTNMGFEANKVKVYTEDALAMVGLTGLKEAYPYNLGKGERQKLALASIIAMQPEILIIDEPTTGLDWLTGKEMIKLLAKINQAGKTVVVITHDMELVAENVPQTVVLYKGHILLKGQTKDVLTQSELLRKTYLKPPQITLFTQEFRSYNFPGEILTVEDAIQAIKIR